MWITLVWENEGITDLRDTSVDPGMTSGLSYGPEAALQVVSLRRYRFCLPRI
jgi:hypothetical protein